MITTGAKLWAAITAFAAIGVVVYGIGSDAELFGIFVLSSLLLVAGGLAIAFAVLRDGTVAAGDDPSGVPPAGPVTPPSVWPVMAALGVLIAAVGLVAGFLLVAVGLLLLAVVAVEWMVQGWSERATGDVEYNRRLRDRVMHPLEVPAFALFAGALVILGVSRVLLAVSQLGAVAVAGVVATIILASASLLAGRPRVSSSVVISLVVLGGAAVLGAGVVGAVVGEREFHPHEAEDHDDGDEDALVVIAQSVAFDTDAIEGHAGGTLTVAFDNRDQGVPHNIAFELPGGTQRTQVASGPDEQALVVRLPDAPGEYPFLCEVHPRTMTGTLQVTD